MHLLPAFLGVAGLLTFSRIQNVYVKSTRLSAQSYLLVRSTLGLGWIEYRFLAFWCVGLGRGSETFPIILILKLGRSHVTAEVIHDNLIMINTDK